jgi:hypothetical protein
MTVAMNTTVFWDVTPWSWTLHNLCPVLQISVIQYYTCCILRAISKSHTGIRLRILPYFSIDDARVIYTKKSKFVKNEYVQYTFERYERYIKCKVEVLLNIYWTLNYSNPKKKKSSLDSLLLLLLLATHVLLKNSSVLCLYFLALPLVAVCALSIHEKVRWKCWGARYLSKNTVLLSCFAGAAISTYGHVTQIAKWADVTVSKTIEWPSLHVTQ